MDQLIKSDMWQYCTREENDKIYFRYDICPEGTSKENWTKFCDIQEDLRDVGWQLDDVQIEHDCITGYLIKFN